MGPTGPAGPPGPAGGYVGAVALADFTGATWDDKLDAAFAYVIAQRAAKKITPPVLLPTDEWSISKGHVVPDGLNLTYPWGPGSLPRSAESVPTLCHYTGTAPMFTLDHTTFDVVLSGLTVESTAGATFFDTGANVLWTSVLEALGGSGWKHFLGSDTSKWLNTACSLQGRWNLNNMLGTAVHLGGSDTFGNMTLSLSDVGSLNPAAFAAAAAYQWFFDGQEKGHFEGWFITAEAGGNGILYNNNRTRNALYLHHFVLEGRNASQPCTGDLLRVQEGVLYVTDANINYAAKPTTTDQGASVVVEAGGRLVLDRVAHKPAQVVGSERPLVYVQSGGEFIGRLASLVGGASGAKVKIVAQTGSFVDVDATFAVTTVA
jgi:hypothetical protein